MMSSQTVFVAFRYCPLCRLNHKKGKKHVYSKRHQDILAIVLSRFLKKITEAKEFLKKPMVQDLTWDQAHKKFWCYFCQDDVGKHRKNATTFGDCIIEYGGILEHIARSDHLENTTKFLKENKLNMKRTTEFIISEKLYLKFLEDIEAVYSHHFAQKIQIVKQVASQIRFQSIMRHAVVASSLQEKILPQLSQNQQAYASGHETNLSKPDKDSFISKERGKKTVEAFGEGLTLIDRLDEDDHAGNIYTNAVPPWMLSDEGSEVSTNIIGPTIEDLEKHKKLERKRQLPACRVGAKFDHKSDQTDSWLPEFGGVWNHGRRTNSAYQFLRRKSKIIEDGIPVSSGGLSNGQDSVSSFQTMPYSFPNISKTSATVTSCSENQRKNIHDECDIETPTAHTDSQFLNNSLHFTTVNATYRSDFSYNHDLGDVKSQHFSPVTEMTSSVDNLWPGSDFVSDNFVPVKPYIRKNKSMAASVSDQSLSSGTTCSLQTLKTIPAGMFNMNNRNSVFEAHASCEKIPHFLPYESDISTLRRQAINGVSTFPVQKYVSPRSQSSVCDSELEVKNSIPFRLIATPVLNHEKSKLSAKRSHETARLKK